MAMTPEKKVKNDVNKILDEFKAWRTAPVTGGYGASGIPDILACVNGYFVGIEVKAKRGKVTPLQWGQLDRIVEATGTALIIYPDNLDDVRTACELLANDEYHAGNLEAFRK